MQLSPHGVLAAIELAVFAPTLLISAYICFRHGFNRQLGWFYLLLLSLLRLIGSSCLLYSETQNDQSKSLLTTYYVCTSIGTAPLLLATMGFLRRINTGMHHGGLGEITFRPIQLVSLAALIVVIVGSTDFGSSKPSDARQGALLAKVGAVLFFVVWAALAAITAWTALHISHVLTDERILMFACVASIPFLLVRIAYTLAVGFAGSPSSPFWRYGVNIYAQALMQFAMEAIVVVIFIVAGLSTPKAQMERRTNRQVEGDANFEMESGKIHSSRR